MGHLVCIGERRGAYRIVVGRPGGRRPLGRPRCRLEDNIKNRSLGSGMGRYGLYYSGSGQGQVGGARECGNESCGSIKCVDFLD